MFNQIEALPFEKLIPYSRADFYKAIYRQLQAEPIFQEGRPLNIMTIAMGGSIKDQLIAPIPNGSVITVLDRGPFLSTVNISQDNEALFSYREWYMGVNPAEEFNYIFTTHLDRLAKLGIGKYDLIKLELATLGYEISAPEMDESSPQVFRASIYNPQAPSQRLNLQFIEMEATQFMADDSPAIVHIKQTPIDFLNLKATDTALIGDSIRDFIMCTLSDNGVIITDEITLPFHYKMSNRLFKLFNLENIPPTPEVKLHLQAGQRWGYVDSETKNMILLRKTLK